MSKMTTDEMHCNVYKTYNYDKFQFLEDNRHVKESRVKKIKESIDEVGLILQPVLVNEKYEIIDGQGRFNACKEKGLPIYYVVQKGLGIEECRWLNKGQENWRVWDWINSFADGGNVDYQRFRTFVNNSRLSLSFITPLAFDNYVHNGTHDQAIMDGKLKFSKRTANDARWVVDYLEEYIPIKKQLKGRADAWYGALIYSYQNLDTQQRNRLLDIVKKNVMFIECYTSMETNLQVFDTLFNKGLRKNNQIHLELSYRTEQI